MAGALGRYARSPLLPPALDAIAISAIAVIPLNLTAALAIQLSSDLGFTPGALGVASSTFFGAQAVASPLVGRIVDRVGANTAMRLSALLITIGLTLAATLARSLPTLLIGLFVAGATNALAQPATNQFVAERIPARRQGSAFGLKQSAIPVSSLLAGLAVPVLGLTLGWRPTFLIFAAIALVFALRMPGGKKVTERHTPPPGTGESLSTRALLLLTVTSGIAAACGTSFGVFLVAGAVDGGWSEAASGVLLAAASAVGVIGRILAGVRADYRGRNHIARIALMMILGAVGALLMAIGAKPTYLIGALIAYGLGWGWPGLFIFAVVRLNTARPAAATAFVQMGTAVGAVTGPFLFGRWIDAHSFSSAWLFVMAGLVIAGVGIWLTQRYITRERATRDPAAPAPGTASGPDRGTSSPPERTPGPAEPTLPSIPHTPEPTLPTQRTPGTAEPTLPRITDTAESTLPPEHPAPPSTTSGGEVGRTDPTAIEAEHLNRRTTATPIRPTTAPKENRQP